MIIPNDVTDIMPVEIIGNQKGSIVDSPIDQLETILLKGNRVTDIKNIIRSLKILACLQSDKYLK